MVFRDKGYYVMNTETRRMYSKAPMTRANAEAQLRILNGAMHREHRFTSKKFNPVLVRK